MRSLTAIPSRETRVDLHLHSRASTDTGSWFLNRAVLPESYTEPADAYATAKRRGMDLVTLTDHNTISGALEIAHHPDVVIGVEITTSFPEDRVPVHVLAWGVDEARWADMDRLRPSVYELIDYMDAARIPFALAHPLHRVGDRLTADHIERCLLLFRLWEGRNGSRPAATNEVAVRIAGSASRDLLTRLADKHGMPPCGDGPPALTGGSDDHGAFDIASTWTVTPPARSPQALLEHLRCGRVAPGGGHGGSGTLAHSVGSLAAKGYLERGTVAVPAPLRGLLGDLLQHRLPPPPGGAAGAGGSEMAVDVMSRLRADRRLVRRYRRIGRTTRGGERSHARLRLATGWLHEELVRRALDPRNLGLSTLGRRVEALAGAGALALPYLLAANYARGEVRFAEAVEGEFFGPTTSAPAAVPAVMVTDTFAELNGVGGTMRRLAGYAAAHPEARMRVLTCGGDGRDVPGHRDLRAVTRFPVPAYGDRDWTLGVPSIIDLLEAVEESGARVVHAATPGPMGISALVVARTLGIPFVASHHTELAQYALELTGDRLAAELTDRAVRWFYGQAERVYVPTRATGAALIAGGIAPERIFSFTRGTDARLFDPERRTRTMRRRLGGAEAETVVLYVGRLSAEKGLLALADSFRRAAAARPGLHLALVGDGPGRAEIEAALAGTPHRFLGVLKGEELASAYASADLFCLPSETETFGQVVTEAAASGLPAVVIGRGGAAELVADGETGLLCPPGDPVALAAAIAVLHDNTAMRIAMGLRARTAARARPSWDDVFAGLLAGYRDLVAPASGVAPVGTTARTTTA
ncbi:MAG: glycosyltransferase [Thermoleophilia bacterium]|nr:glycosyltransferase [Thermoleophilia bacterium]